MDNSGPFLYAKRVLNNEIVVGSKIKLAIIRFYKWIETAEADGYYLDHNAGMKVLHFFETFLKHTKGPMAGLPFILSPYQQFTYYNIFAWKHKSTGLRRINTVYEKVARKSGKTAGLSGLGLFLESFDGENSPEIYVGATKELQAKVLWDQAVQFISVGRKLNGIGFKSLQREIKFPRTLGTFKYLGGDSKTLDGLNPSAAFIDEYHAHKDDGVREILESAMGGRSNPLTYIITTAGLNVYSVCKQSEDVFVEILEGHKVDNSVLVMIHDIDDGDDWKDASIWEKANPNIRFNPTIRPHLVKELKKAENQPSKIPNFKTKHLNMWVDAPEVWISTEDFAKGKVTDYEGYNSYEELFFAKCKKYGSMGGVDLSTVKDMTSFDIVTFPDENKNQFSKTFNFCPEKTIDERSREDNVPYRYWRDAGWLISTPGNMIDYDVLLDYIVKYYSKCNMKRIEFDKFNSSHIMTILQQRGINVSHFPQGITVMSFPTKQFERAILSEKYKHDGNIVVEWALSGCVIYRDANENIKVHKGYSHRGKKRIDSIVAKIMSFAATIDTEVSKKPSKYNDPNVVVSF